jgi:hypothetical protein
MYEANYNLPQQRKKTMKTKKTDVTLEWLTAKMRNGRKRIEVLGWKRLAAIHACARPGSDICKAINTEARRCGYSPRKILTINVE